MDADKLWEQREDQFGHLPGPILRDLARNDSTPHAMRKEAVRLMIDKGYPEASHPDLVMFVSEIRSEQEARDEVVSVVESAIEEPLPEVVNTPLVMNVPNPPQKPVTVRVKKQMQAAKPAGPLSASVTTATMFQNEVVQNAAVQETDNAQSE